MAILCRLISSIAATAAVAALLFGRAFRLPSTFTQDPVPFPPTYSASASAPSLSPPSSSLRTIRGRDFFRLIAVLVEFDVEEDPSDVVEPVVRVGGPGEYIAAADPGRDAGSGKSSGLM
jgi:hypothetical protein